MITKNSIKQFLKPNWKKVLLGLIFIGLIIFTSSWLWDKIGFRRMGGIDVGIGIPFEFYFYRSSAPLPNTRWLSEILSPFYLALDLIFWYLISCLLISIWDKIKAKKPVV